MGIIARGTLIVAPKAKPGKRKKMRKKAAEMRDGGAQARGGIVGFLKVCSPGVHGGFCLWEKGCGVLLGFFHCASALACVHTHTRAHTRAQRVAYAAGCVGSRG